MGTNYYFKNYDEKNMDSPKWHLGKRINIGKGKNQFIWATNLKFHEFSQRLIDLELEPFTCIVNEYGDVFTLTEFMNLVFKCQYQDINIIGQKFS